MKRIAITLRHEDLLKNILDALRFTSKAQGNKVDIFALNTKDNGLNEVLSVITDANSFGLTKVDGYLIHSQESWNPITDNLEQELSDFNTDGMLVENITCQMIGFLANLGIDIEII